MAFDVLLTGAGALLGQGILKALRASAHVRRVVAADMSPLAVGLHLADRAYLVPPFTAPSYVDEIVRIAKTEGVQAILCGTDVEVGTLSARRAEIEERTSAKLIVSGPEAVAIADDKWKTVQFLREHGLDAPRSALADGAEALAREVGFPLIAKPRNGAGSVGLHRVRTMDELRLALKDEGMVVQEHLLPDDEEYTVGAVVTEGKCRAVVALRRTLRYGNTHTAVSDDFPEVRAFVARAAEALPGAYGPVNFQLRKTARGPVVFEINARFSGTTPLRAELGFNEVEAVLRHAIEGVPVPAGTLRRGLVLRWTSEVVVPLQQVDALRTERRLEAPQGEMLGVLRRGTP